MHSVGALLAQVTTTCVPLRLSAAPHTLSEAPDRVEVSVHQALDVEVLVVELVVAVEGDWFQVCSSTARASVTVTEALAVEGEVDQSRRHPVGEMARFIALVRGPCQLEFVGGRQERWIRAQGAHLVRRTSFRSPCILSELRASVQAPSPRWGDTSRRGSRMRARRRMPQLGIDGVRVAVQNRALPLTARAC